MLQIFITIILIFGGLFFLFIDWITFKNEIPNIYIILSIILAIIPGLGIVSYGVKFLFDVFNYEKDNFCSISKRDVILRNTKINHFLFNDVDWDNYEKYIKEK